MIKFINDWLIIYSLITVIDISVWKGLDSLDPFCFNDYTMN